MCCSQRFVLFTSRKKELRKDSLDSRTSSRFTYGYSNYRCLCVPIIQRVKSRNLFEWFVLRWGIHCALVQQAINDGIVVLPIKYENFIADFEKVIRSMLQFLGLPNDLVRVSICSLKTGSQPNTRLSWENQKKNKRVWQRTNDSVARCNSILKAFNLPDLDSSFTMEGTLYTLCILFLYLRKMHMNRAQCI